MRDSLLVTILVILLLFQLFSDMVEHFDENSLVKATKPRYDASLVLKKHEEEL